jgi:hypothetical protein
MRTGHNGNQLRKFLSARFLFVVMGHSNLKDVLVFNRNRPTSTRLRKPQAASRKPQAAAHGP